MNHHKPQNASETQGLHGNLRQMIAVLEAERQALATLEADALNSVTQQKGDLCDALAGLNTARIDDEARALVETAKSLNDVNRRVRNLLAANVAGRLEALGARRPGNPGPHAYSVPSMAG